MGRQLPLFLKLLRLFPKQYGDLVAQVRDDLKRKDYESAGMRLHTLKRDMASLGALEIMTLADTLETAIERREADLDESLEHLALMIATLIRDSAAWR